MFYTFQYQDQFLLQEIINASVLEWDSTFIFIRKAINIDTLAKCKKEILFSCHTHSGQWSVIKYKTTTFHYSIMFLFLYLQSCLLMVNTV